MCQRVIRFHYGRCGCVKTVSHRWILRCKVAKCVAAVESRRRKPEPVEMRKKHYTCDRHQRRWGIDCPTHARGEHARGDLARQPREAQEERHSRRDSREEPPAPNFSMPRGAPSYAPTGASPTYDDDDRYSAYTAWTSSDELGTENGEEERYADEGPAERGSVRGDKVPARACDGEEPKKKRGLRRVLDVFSFLDTSSDDEVTGREK